MNKITKISGSASNAAAEQQVIFPSDIVPSNKKEYDHWIRQWVDAIINYGQYCFTERDASNQNCALGIINAGDYAHITDLFVAPTQNNKPSIGNSQRGRGGFKKALPAKLRPINVVAAAENKFVGRIEGEGFDFAAYVVNEDAVSQKLEDFSAEYAAKLTRFARQQAGLDKILGTHLIEGDEVEQVIPEEVENAKFSTFQQENEIQVTRGLAYLLSKKNIFLQHKFVEQGARSFYRTGKMAFDTFIENDPNAQFIPPQNLIYELNSNSPFIQHGRYCGYFWAGTPQEIIDKCPELTKQEIDQIEAQFKVLQNQGAKNGLSTWYRWDGGINTFLFTPYKVYWSALKRMKVKITPNKFDEENPHIHFVDEKEKANEDKGEKIEYRYLKTWFEGTKIGMSVYYQCREIPGQHRPQDEPEIVDSPLIGIVNPNPCPVDLIKPLAELRTECWFSIERLLGQAKGNILVVDEAGGQDVFGQNYNMLAYGVYVHDSSLESPDGAKAQQMPVTKDMGLSQAVTDLMRTIAFIDQNIALVTGDNDASRGVVKSDQTLGVTQNALQQAQFTLQPYYAMYYTTVEMALQALCNLMRPAWSGRKKTAYFMGDSGYEFLNLDPGSKWNLADYGIFLRNSVGSTAAKKLMVGVGTQIMERSSDPEMALAVMKMVRAKSDAECEQIFKKTSDALRKIKNASDQREQANKQAEIQAMMTNNQERNQIENKKADSPVNVAVINAQAKDKLQDKKNAHKEDEQSVQFKNDIAMLMADIMAEREKNKQPQEENVGV